MLHYQGDLDGVQRQLKKARSLYGALGDIEGLAHTLNDMGLAARRQGDQRVRDLESRRGITPKPCGTKLRPKIEVKLAAQDMLYKKRSRALMMPA